VMSNTKFILGVYEDEDILLNAITNIRTAGVKIHEVYSPFPVHGIDDVLGYKRSKLSIVAFLFGVLGTSLAPSFVPVIFELTVLLAAYGMCFTFFIVSDLKPWAKPRIFDLRITDDKHVMAIDLDQNKIDVAKIDKILKDNGENL